MNNVSERTIVLDDNKFFLLSNQVVFVKEISQIKNEVLIRYLDNVNIPLSIREKRIPILEFLSEVKECH